GIGNLANKVKSVFHAVAKPVNRAIDKIVDFIVKKGKAFWEKLKKKAGKNKNKNDEKDTPSEESKSKASEAALQEATSLVDKNSTIDGIRSKLPEIRSRHGVRVLKLIVDRVDKARTLIHFRAVNSPPRESPQQNIPDLSSICGPLRKKIGDVSSQVHDSQVKGKLKHLDEEARKLDERVSAGQLSEPSDRLTALRGLGDRLRQISEDAGILHLLENGPDFSKLSIPVSDPQTIKSGDVEKLDLPAGTKILYVVRDSSTREILKVGETTAGPPLTARFDRYDRAARRLDKKVEIEVRTVTLPQGQGIRQHEQDLRDQLDYGASNRLPWDNTEIAGIGPRLGRRGPGTPFESLPGGSPLRREGWQWNENGELTPPNGAAPPSFRRANAPPEESVVRGFLSTHGGDVQAAATAAGVSGTTIYRWLRRYNIDISDYK
ncbi:hypothetical protein ACFXPY_39730, partial [Streptomyces sp. NPDC059153]